MVIENQSVSNLLIRLTIFQEFAVKTFKVKVAVFSSQPVLFTFEERLDEFSICHVEYTLQYLRRKSTVKCEIKELRKAPAECFSIGNTFSQKVNVKVSCSFFSRTTRTKLPNFSRHRVTMECDLSFIPSKHLDKPSAGDGVPNILHHQFIGRNALRRVDECS